MNSIPDRVVTDMANLTPEQEAREQIDAQLQAAGWVIQSTRHQNLGALLGVAVREFRESVQTLLRLPRGIFYAQGMKGNVLFFDRKPANEKPWTERLWIYDLRTNKHFTLKTQQMKFDDLKDFIACFNPENRHQRKESERFRAFDYADLMKRDKAGLDIFWLKDDSLEDSENLPEPDVLAEIRENMETALEMFGQIEEKLDR